MSFQWKDEWTTPALVGGASFLLGAAVSLFGKHIYDKRKYTILEATVQEDGQLTFNFPEKMDEVITNLHHEVSRLKAFDPQEMKEKVDELGYSVPADQVIREEVVQIDENGEEWINDMPIEEALEFYKMPDISAVKENAAKLAPIEAPTVEVNVFRNQDDDWDWEAEKRKRNPSKPYIIHKDEFFEENPDFDLKQHELTYYGGDGVLVDEYDTVVERPERVVGELKFGHGSQDPNVVYIRNVSQDTEFEVTLDDRAYSTVVLGETLDESFNHRELRHSAVPKFRRE